MAQIVILGTQATTHHFSPLMDHFGARMVVEPDWRPSVIAAHRPDLVISFEESNPERGLCIAEAVRQNVATLLVMDGIPEWRNTWSRANGSRKRPINQPVLSHKVACLGLADARLYESWGNLGKCEVTGAVRFDHLVEMRREMRTRPVEGRPLRLLVMTAKTPGFTPEEVAITTRSLADLRDVLEDRSDIQVTWRLTQGLHQELAVKNTFTDSSGQELHEVLAQVDAVITTPSTAMLEAMLFGHPVALLDYHNCPHYIPAAWRITSREQIPPVLADLRSVPLNRMLYQDFCLHDSLSCRTPAAPRLVELIESMIRIKQEHESSRQGELAFPYHILDAAEPPTALPHAAFDLQALYPTHPVFQRSDLAAMQAELEAALLAVEELKEQNRVLTGRLHTIPGYLFFKQLTRRLKKRGS